MIDPIPPKARLLKAESPLCTAEIAFAHISAPRLVALFLGLSASNPVARPCLLLSLKQRVRFPRPRLDAVSEAAHARWETRTAIASNPKR